MRCLLILVFACFVGCGNEVHLDAECELHKVKLIKGEITKPSIGVLVTPVPAVGIVDPDRIKFPHRLSWAESPVGKGKKLDGFEYAYRAYCPECQNEYEDAIDNWTQE